VDEIYACEQWKVKPGQEDEFIRRFREFAAWTLGEFPGAVIGAARLIQHADDPTRFVSFGRFASIDALERWRAHPHYEETEKRIAETLESGDAGVYALRVQLGAPGSDVQEEDDNG